MQELLGRARREYTSTISELEHLGSSLQSGGETLSTCLEALRRSRLLHDTAAEFDTGIGRLTEAMAHMDEALAALQGRGGQAGPEREPSESSMEAVAIQAQEEERYRLAREIHDGPAQILSNVAFQLEYISKLAGRDPARARDEMATIQKDLRLAVGEVRRFMYDLRPPALAQQGVGPAVESHCQRLAGRFGMKIEVDWQADSALLPSHDTAVFRIVQEALQNVVKHAQATDVRVCATETDQFLEVSVTDNGMGFEPERARSLDPNRFGLAGMRARAQQIGASLEVTSTPERGTTILLRVPHGHPMVSDE